MNAESAALAVALLGALVLMLALLPKYRAGVLNSLGLVLFTGGMLARQLADAFDQQAQMTEILDRSRGRVPTELFKEFTDFHPWPLAIAGCLFGFAAALLIADLLRPGWRARPLSLKGARA